MCLVLFLILIFLNGAQGQSGQKKKLYIQDLKAYQSAVRKSPEKTLVEIKRVIPGVKLDIRYATTANFMRQVMYKQARAFARRDVVAQLKKIQQELHGKGYGLLIFDAYRPYRVTVAFYQKAADKNFVANPAKGSVHNRGCAVDLSLFSLKTGKELVMPTPYDSFSPMAAANYPKADKTAIRNRSLLISTMQKYGFKVMRNEWWHFDYNGWQNYELADIPFERL